MSKQTKQTFSIRKYAVGTASVLLGVSALAGATLVSTDNVEAATFVTVLDGVEHAETIESLDSAEAVEKKGLELIEYYKQYGYKPVDPSTYQPVVGDTFYLRFTKEAEDDRHFTIVVNVDGEEVSRRTHTVNDEAAENLAQEAARHYSDDNKYIPLQPKDPQENVKIISPTEIELTINLVENPRKIKIVDKDGVVSEQKFQAQTDLEWQNEINAQIEKQTTDTQVYDEDESYFDSETGIDVLVFRAKEADPVHQYRVIYDGVDNGVTPLENLNEEQFLEAVDAVVASYPVDEFDVATDIDDNGVTVITVDTKKKEVAKELVLEVYENGTLVSSATAADEDGLTALQVNATETKIGEGFKPGEILHDGNTLKLYFTKEAPVAPKVEALENFTITLVDGDNKQVSEFKAITHSTFLEQLAALSQAGDDVAYTTSNDVVITRAVSAPVAEKLEDFTITIVDGDSKQTSTFASISHSAFLEHLAALSQAGDDVAYTTLNDVVITRAVSAPVVEKLEDFKIILKVDGKEVQTSDFAGISYADFLEHLSALTEAKLAEGLKQDSVDYDGNVATLSFTTPKKEAKLNENLTANPLPEYKGNLATKPVVTSKPQKGQVAANGSKSDTDSKETQSSTKPGNPAVELGNKKAANKSENNYKAVKTLPSTGDSSAAALAMAGLAVAGLGLVGLKKRHADK
ncbi:YSIRK-type signal peptide-containing protein [Streptococcus pluranimalium]